MLCNFIEITVWHGRSPVNLMHNFRTPFSKNTSEGLLLRVLTEDLSIVIIPGNKGSCVVFQDRKDHLAKTENNLKKTFTCIEVKFGD